MAFPWWFSYYRVVFHSYRDLHFGQFAFLYQGAVSSRALRDETYSKLGDWNHPETSDESSRHGVPSPETFETTWILSLDETYMDRSGIPQSWIRIYEVYYKWMTSQGSDLTFWTCGRSRLFPSFSTRLGWRELVAWKNGGRPDLYPGDRAPRRKAKVYTHFEEYLLQLPEPAPNKQTNTNEKNTNCVDAQRSINAWTVSPAETIVEKRPHGKNEGNRTKPMCQTKNGRGTGMVKFSLPQTWSHKVSLSPQGGRSSCEQVFVRKCQITYSCS